MRRVLCFCIDRATRVPVMVFADYDRGPMGVPDSLECESYMFLPVDREGDLHMLDATLESVRVRTYEPSTATR